ncbi:MAG: methyltransferase domain-containing protein [Acidobacteria bacterium]|nr:methyltransferase domain-containing protein [Acidobacteriota bacterium]
MNQKLLNILCCPKCQSDLELKTDDVGEINEGLFKCLKCGKEYPITNGIPRFVELDNYASSFGYQWNIFRKEQLDTYNGTNLSADRLWGETKWDPNALSGEWILDAGCGAGRFLDIASQTAAEVVGIDISNAIDASKENLKGRPNLHLIQSSIYELPFKPGAFDKIYCIGVIQHTPDPEKTVRVLPRFLKKGGEIAVTIYEKRKWFTMLYSKYWFRPITKRMSKEGLLKVIEGVMPVAFPVTSFLFRLPGLGKFFAFVIPVANYVDEKDLSDKQRYQWAVLDTFDMLSPQYDQPQTEADVVKYLKEEGISDISRATNFGLNLIGKRKA